MLTLRGETGSPCQQHQPHLLRSRVGTDEPGPFRWWKHTLLWRLHFFLRRFLRHGCYLQCGRFYTAPTFILAAYPLRPLTFGMGIVCTNRKGVALWAFASAGIAIRKARRTQYVFISTPDTHYWGEGCSRVRIFRHGAHLR